jgi:hypothetical protein
MFDVVEQLDKAIDALSTLDPDTLTDAELDEAVIELQRHRARLGAVAARLLGRWDRRRVWASDQSRSAASSLARDTKTSVGSAKIELRRARQLPSMPATAAAITAGDCPSITSTCWAGPIGRGATRCLPTTRRPWLRSAPNCGSRRPNG